jgi:hypothetical protein
VFGNPFRERAPLAPGLLAWNDGVVRALAQSIDANGRLASRFALTDALEDAGCTDADILDHLRWPWPHVRGCWVLDLILGKE